MCYYYSPIDSCKGSVKKLMVQEQLVNYSNVQLNRGGRMLFSAI